MIWIGVRDESEQVANNDGLIFGDGRGKKRIVPTRYIDGKVREKIKVQHKV